MNKFPTITNFIRDPPLIHLQIFSRLQAIDNAFIVFDRNIVATCGDAINRGRLFQEPDALLKEEIFVQESANWAEVDHIA